eukprot:TRINITY_DN1578_c0_g2_i1.p1 TRINITY_DN1578_c0_g2~~TRINITY_DN1578_c0_g2_i1.p1  ORF type:complete len:562 (+),score=185.55 TRINITY_DN1578_c0_g2_i1:40-1686(+)
MGFDELWVIPNAFALITKRTADGEKFSSDFIKMLEKRAKCELAYVKNLLSLHKSLGEEEIGSIAAVWDSQKVEVDSLQQLHATLAENLTALAATMKNSLLEDRKERALLVAKGLKLLKDLQSVEDTMKKTRNTYVNLRKKQDHTLANLQKEKAKNAESKKVGDLQKTFEKDEKKADKSDNEYRITVNNLKSAQDQFYDHDFPALLREFEAFEKKRSITTAKFFEQFVSFDETIGPSTRDSSERFRKKVSAINTDSDLVLFVSDSGASSTPQPPRAVYRAYDDDGTNDPTPQLATSSLSPTSNSASPSPRGKKEKKGLLGRGKSKRKASTAKPIKTKKNGDEKSSDKSTESPVVVIAAPSPSSNNEVPPQPPTGQSTETATQDESPTPAPVAEAGDAASTPSGPEQGAGSDGAQPQEEETADGEEVLLARYEYEATDEGEIGFREGEKIVLLNKDESGWWVGRNEAGETGSFPSNFVELDEGDGESQVIEINADYRALYDYEAEDETELTIKEGDILHVQTETDGWYYGSNVNGGEEGTFPSNFVEMVA